MTLDEFVKQSNKRGYSSKKQAEEWCERHPKSDYTEDDMIELYRHFNSDISCSKWRNIYGGHRSTKHYKDIGSDR